MNAFQNYVDSLGLSRDVEEYIFRKVMHEYYVEDAAAQAAQYVEDNYTPEQIKMRPICFDYDYLADLFEERHDCNVADNDLWQQIIGEYCKANDFAAYGKNQLPTNCI